MSSRGFGVLLYPFTNTPDFLVLWFVQAKVFVRLMIVQHEYHTRSLLLVTMIKVWLLVFYSDKLNLKHYKFKL